MRVHATTVYRTDCAFRSAKPAVNRPFSGLLRPRRRILGTEFAGEVERIGASVTTFAPSDRVFGVNASSFGAHAEFLCIAQTAPVATIPDEITFEEAAAVCDGAIIALSCLRAANLRLGAHAVLDYTRQDFTAVADPYDIVFDAVGKTTFRHCRSIIKPGGIMIETDLGFRWQNVVLAAVTWRLGSRRVLIPIPRYTQANVLLIKDLLAARRYRAVIDRRYPLEEVIPATRYVETHQKTGNVVLTIGDDRGRLLVTSIDRRDRLCQPNWAENRPFGQLRPARCRSCR